MRKLMMLGMAAGALAVLGMAGRRAPDGRRATAVMLREVEALIAARGLEADFNRYQDFVDNRLDASAGTNTYSDKTGNCRLGWVDFVLRNQRIAAREAEAESRRLQEAVVRRADSAAEVFAFAFGKLDVPGPFLSPARPGHEEGLAFLQARLAGMRDGLDRWWAPMPEEDRRPFLDLLKDQALGSNVHGHRFANNTDGRRACDLLESLDREGLQAAACQAAALADGWRAGRLDRWLDELAVQPATAAVKGVTGPVAGVWETPYGLIVAGGAGDNVYRLEENPAIAMVVDLGGNDVYEEGVVSLDRPVLVLVDRHGNDRYTGRLPGIQAAAWGGVSIILEGGGDDVYEAGDLAQGACLAGVGLLIDLGGNDRYTADRRAQGHAIGGVGLLLDYGGDDVYHGAMLVQGVGGPLGFGLLADVAGADHYFAGGKYPGGYDDSPGFGGWSQGVGVGPRGAANGGIGVLLDGGGDDVYEYDYFSHGGGYWFAVGIARDFGGNDQRKGSAAVNWDGTPRTVKPFVRWGPAYGCHYAAGFLFDDEGDDLYTGTSAGVCFGWDLALAVLCDAGGNDTYVGGATGQGAQGAMAILFDGSGDDVYRSGNLGVARPDVPYHPQLATNANFSFVIDLGGGVDEWPKGLTNGQTHVRGWAGGAVVSR